MATSNDERSSLFPFRFTRLPDADQWDSRAPWKGGDKRGDLNQRGRWNLDLGRFQIGFAWAYVGDRYGRIGADGWQIYLTFVRNPR